MSELEEQLREVEMLIREDPENEELGKVAKQLEEAIQLLKPRKIFQDPLVGKMCEVNYDGNWLTAKIISISGELARVQFISQAITNEYALASLRVLQPLEPRLCVSGAKLQAIYPKDGNWYDCEVIASKPDGYLVQFEGYKERLILSADHLRRRKIVKIDPVEAYVTPAGYRIPQNLKISEADTDKVKEDKKRKIHHVKQQQRNERQEEEANVKQNAWKAFNKKLKKYFCIAQHMELLF